MLRVEYAIEKPSNKLLAVTGLESDNWVGGNLSKSGWEARLLSPFPLSSAVEARGRRLSGRLPRVALADSLTRGCFLKPLRGFTDGEPKTPSALHPPAPAPPKP